MNFTIVSKGKRPAWSKGEIILRDRAAVIILDKGNVLLIKRVKDGETYYVFPGGGIEAGETPEEAARREAFEELGAEVKLNGLFTRFEFHGVQHYFLAEVKRGVLGSGTGEEFADDSKGTYEPMWLEICMLSSLEVRPREVVSLLRKSFCNRASLLPPSNCE